MDNLLSLGIMPVGRIKALLAQRARARRMDFNLSRKTLAERSLVPESTIKRFERDGEISLDSLLKIALVLDCLAEFGAIFPPKPIITLEDVLKKPRQRGRK